MAWLLPWMCGQSQLCILPSLGLGLPNLCNERPGLSSVFYGASSGLFILTHTGKE